MSDSDQSRSRRNSYSSESFHSENDSVDELKARRASKLPSKQHAGNAGGTRNSSRNSGSQPGNHGANNATRRMLSAGRIKINELRNKISELTGQLANVQTENKELQRQLRQQERKLMRYDQQESDAPVVVQRIGEEAHALREQLKRSKEKCDSKTRKLKEVSEELDSAQRLLKKMKTLVDDKKLAERTELARRLEQAEFDLKEKDKTIKDMEKHIQHLNKNHKHELGIERARHRETQRQLDELQELDSRLRMQLKEKEKELEVKNIYARKYAKPPHRLDSSISSTPVPEVHQFTSKPRLLNINSDSRSTSGVASRTEMRNDDDRDKNVNEDNSYLKVEHRKNEEESRRLRSEERSRQIELEQRKLKEAEKAEEKLRAERERAQLDQLEKDRVERDRLERQEREREEREKFAQLQNSVDERERQRQKELLLAKMKAIDEGNRSSNHEGNRSSNQKSTPATASGDGKVDDFGLTFGDYKPSFLTEGSASTKPNKKASDRKPDLAGDRRSNDIFNDTSSVYNIDADSTSTVRESNGVVDQRNGYLLPRRNRQSVLAVTRNTSNVNVVSDLGEDLEEMTL